jgi:hypothetical protein
MQNLKYVAIVIGIVMMLLTLLFAPSSAQIHNTSKYDITEHAEKLASIMGLEDVEIYIVNMAWKLYGQRGEVVGTVTEARDENGTPKYVLYLAKDLNSFEATKTLVHEMIHIWQFSTGRMKKVDQKIIWYGFIEYKGSDPYNSPWEKEARTLTPLILDKIL